MLNPPTHARTVGTHFDSHTSYQSGLFFGEDRERKGLLKLKSNKRSSLTGWGSRTRGDPLGNQLELVTRGYCYLGSCPVETNPRFVLECREQGLPYRMTTATSTRPSARTPWPSHSQSRQRPKPSTTPLGLPTRTPASVGQSMAPLLSARARSPSQTHDPRSPSPSYFGLIVEAGSNPVDSNAGVHVKGNWSPPSSAIRPVAVTSPKHLPLDSNQEFEAFRKQSETHTFSLSHGNLSHFSMGSSSGRLPTLGSLASSSRDSQQMEVDSSSQPTSPKATTNRPQRRNSKDINVAPITRTTTTEQKVQPTSTLSICDLPCIESPLKLPSSDEPRSQRNHLPHVDDRHPRLSLPGNRTDPPLPSVSDRHLKRAETLPPSLNPDGPVMIPPQNLVDLLKNWPEEVLLLDLRVSPQYMQSRIRGALNLCIPTTLLKRPSFNIQKLAETFTEEREKAKFADWKQSKYIVVYDTSATQLKDAVSCVNTLKKFVNQGWQGEALIVRGGFLDFSRRYPDMVEMKSNSNTDGSNRTNLSIDAKMAGIMPVIGGCPMPSTQTAANPFFGNIRQNTDLIAGVGQMPIKHPAALTERGFMELPQWIREAADHRDQGKLVADRFLKIEIAEQARMQKALSGNVSYGLPTLSSSQSVQLAGIEKGTKNRYKDMLPYDHSRVRLQNVPSGGCDYVNASHVKAGWSNRRYIATQAPVPATFEVSLLPKKMSR